MNTSLLKWPIALLCFWLLAVPLSQCRAAEAPVVVVFGDSITEGSALPKAERHLTWLHYVEVASGGALRMVNEGKGGRATNSVKEFEAMLTRQPRADFLVLALGTNDSRNLAPECVPRAVENLRAMITKGREAYGEKVQVVLVGPPNIRKDALGPTRPIADQRDAKLRELGAAFAELAKELRCKFVSLHGVVPAASLARDGVHPDAAGNEAIAKVIAAGIAGGRGGAF